MNNILHRHRSSLFQGSIFSEPLLRNPNPRFSQDNQKLHKSLDSKAEERKHVSKVLKANGYTKTFLRNCPKPVTTSSTPDVRGNQRLVSSLFPTSKMLRDPARQFWIATTLKLLKNLYFCQTYGSCHGRKTEPTLFILFRAMTVITSTSDRPNVNLVHVWKSIKKRSSFAKRKFSFIGAHNPSQPYS